MAKKKENKKTSKSRGANRSSDSSTPPEKSGEVKGPMGVGGRKKAGSGAIIKKPAKNKETETPKDEPEKGITSGSLPLTDKGSIGKALPEKTSGGEEHLVVTSEGKSSSSQKSSRKSTTEGMHPKDNTPIILEEFTETER